LTDYSLSSGNSQLNIMTIAYLHLVTLKQSASGSTSSTVDNFLALIHQHANSYRYTPLITSRGRHWVARPKVTDAKDLNRDWVSQDHGMVPD